MKPTFKILTAMAAFALAGTAGQAFAQGEPYPVPAAVPAPAPAADPYAAPAPASAPAAAYPAATPVAPALSGALPGSTAADLNGDGVADGYYGADGVYHAFTAPVAAPAPNLVSRRGERG